MAEPPEVEKAPGIVGSGPAKVKPTGGVGTVLKSIFGWVGIAPDKDCHCCSIQGLLDARGPAWCAANFERIIRWLKRAAQRRRYVWVPSAARIALRGAIEVAAAKERLVTSCH